jgi:hypothetical protein
VAQLTLKIPELGEEGSKIAVASGLSSADWALLPFFKKCVSNGMVLFPL